MTVTQTPAANDSPIPPGRQGLFTLMVGAIGVVFGDIGTSPLYALKETFAGEHPLPLDAPHILGALSLIVWTLTLVVTVKYVVYVLRADNRGEGGSLALMARLMASLSPQARILPFVTLTGIAAAALFYGDCVITPAISVLSAVEGLKIAVPHMEDAVVPATVTILIALFLIQRFGTEVVGRLFGPVCIVWFVVLAALGIHGIAAAPEVLSALSPHHALRFLSENGLTGLLILGAVVLAVTGAEALYADMGHFGRPAIRLGWTVLVMPALLLNYLGQGALLLKTPAAIASPFFLLAPKALVLPLVILATLATVIASQAVISGAFSLTRQAIQLGYLPRMTIVHTSEHEIGQIYMPIVNWALMIACVTLVLTFGSSSELAAAYGIAVTGNMVITTLLLAVAMRTLWGWPTPRLLVLCGLFLLVDLAFFASNITKIGNGGWVPLGIAAVLFCILTTWKAGRALLIRRLTANNLPDEHFATLLAGGRLARVPGTAVFLTGTTSGLPMALMHNLKHNKVAHERVILLTVITGEIPVVPLNQRVSAREVSPGLHRLTLRYGFMETPDIPKALAQAREQDLGFFYEPGSISYFLSREIILPSREPTLPLWRTSLFAWMARSATGAMGFFRLPPGRVVELGAQVEL